MLIQAENHFKVLAADNARAEAKRVTEEARKAEVKKAAEAKKA